MYKNGLKRFLDFLTAVTVLLIVCIPLLLIILLLLLESKGPLFFRQVRVGKDLNLFSIYKFRTMTHEKREVGTTPIIGKAEGVTRVGYYLRRYKIDELPQLINVLNGDMSLVGPRPSIPEQLEKMTESEKTRYSVRPGLTGLAQVNGNIYLNWPERYIYDLQYIKNINFGNDIRIVFRTIFIVIWGEKKFLNKPVALKEN
jgi:undecaprenyl phosphate N,N'-diacetylbacillosamine 1-phosphate transferase